MSFLSQIVGLSHKFGNSNYVLGGGGNTSAKDGNALWIKPSGTTLCHLKSEDFVALDRKKLNDLDQIDSGLESQKREQQVQKTMTLAKLDPASGRPSVESPLHNIIEYRFIVHTHPAVVNGMTCGKNGAQACKELFPDALWLNYIDPGYVLYAQAKEEINRYKDNTGKMPEMIFLKNHGVFISADSPNRITELYADIFEKLNSHYRNHDVSADLKIGPSPDSSKVQFAKEQLISAYGQDVFVAASGYFDIAEGPVSPDHIVYSGSFPYVGRPDAMAFHKHKQRFGYLPRVVADDDLVLGVGLTQKTADLSLAFAQNGAEIKHLANAFGSIEYMTDKGREFIENWEAEVYRSKQV